MPRSIPAVLKLPFLDQHMLCCCKTFQYFPGFFHLILTVFTPLFQLFVEKNLELTSVLYLLISLCFSLTLKFSYLMQNFNFNFKFKTTNFPLNISFPAPHSISCIVFSLSISQKYFLISLATYFLIFRLFRNIFCNFNVFGAFPEIFLLLIFLFNKFGDMGTCYLGFKSFEIC